MSAGNVVDFETARARRIGHHHDTDADPWLDPQPLEQVHYGCSMPWPRRSAGARNVSRSADL